MAPEIMLDKDTCLTADRRNWSLQEKVKDKRELCGWRWEGYSFHVTIEEAINHFCQEKLRGTNCKSFESLARAHRKLQKTVAALLKSAGLGDV